MAPLLAPLLGLMLAACTPGIEVAHPVEIAAAEGKQFTDFTAEDHLGRTVRLSDVSRDAVVVLIFYRGSW